MQRRLLSGSYECSLDNRFRLAIPARLRDRFATGATVGWWLDECVIVVPRAEWPDLMDRTFGEMDVFDDGQRELSRFLLAGALEQDLDRQGRVLLPPHLREHAELEGTVRVLGTGDYLEVWNPQKVAERFDKVRREGVSSLAQRFAGRA